MDENSTWIPHGKFHGMSNIGYGSTPRGRLDTNYGIRVGGRTFE